MSRKSTPRAIRSALFKFINSVWLFPILILLLFLTFTMLRISGSSIGAFETVLFGSQQDTSHVAGNPRTIRTDEWVVMSEMVIAQKEAGYPSINTNIGNGQNMNVVLDVPTKNWSQIFRPQNWLFAVAPFENAFAYRWWFTAVLILLSTYFLVLHFSPKRRLIASAIAFSLYFSAFVQWWYLGVTLGTIGYSMLLILLYAKMITTDSLRAKLMYATSTTYAILCFLILLYPPFQIPCAITAFVFALGYTFYIFPGKKKLTGWLKSNVLYILAILASVAVVSLVFAAQNKSTIDAIENSAYPGRRTVQSGGYSKTHLLSGQLAYQHLKEPVSKLYTPQPNQSEAATFMFLGLFLLLPLTYTLLSKHGFVAPKTSAMPLLTSLFAILFIFMGWLFIPHMNVLGLLTKLDLVPQNRLIIGLGLLNTLALIVFVYIYSRYRARLPLMQSLFFAGVLFLATVMVNKLIQNHSPGFIGNIKMVAYAVPMALAAFLLLRGRLNAGILVFMAFVIVSGISVNPLYRGLGPVVNNPLYHAILSTKSDGSRWIVEDVQFENFAMIAGKKSMSGVFFYPQKELWRNIDGGRSDYLYNRYAHVGFALDHDPNVTSNTGFLPTTADRLIIHSELCSEFMKESKIRHVVSSAQFSTSDQSCIANIQTVTVGSNKIYLYSLAF